ncbi:hypothetical protein AB6F64_01605 [Providencia hangzhouensis]|uniref:Uncharacterized protein n=2 Tax=Providencia TaxID=586 RepID=A0AAJ4TIL0_PRORE|nr:MULTISPECIES: hypothetical protein [Providencia]MBJ9971210.1 hypothetical protein [Providencia rettgeri]MCB6145852.1 hypothetical protein [Providencia rettgeri]MCF8962684.1 hypothetical protein [Providencia rettgeri]QWQ17260.1 hypothetical protein KOL65_01655 [Providencia rettgeri]QWQ21095.1 hypothetical protein KOF27_01655 [Providencia rettgeri]
MHIDTINRNVSNPIFKKNIALEIAKNYSPIINKIRNTRLNNFIHLFSFNKKNKVNMDSKFYLELKKIETKKNENNSRLKVELNQNKIISLENELLKKSFEISPTVKNTKDEINRKISNALKIDKPYVEELVNNKIIKEQNDLIDYYTYHIKNIELIETKEQLKNDIYKLKSEIKNESKIRGIAYLEKKHAILESSYKEIENTFEVEDQNENLKSLINLQSIIKNLLIKELDDVKSKIHNITLDNYSEKNLMAYDEDGTPIYHDENHSFDFDDELTFLAKPETNEMEDSSLVKALRLENRELKNSLEELSDNYFTLLDKFHHRSHEYILNTITLTDVPLDDLSTHEETIVKQPSEIKQKTIDSKENVTAKNTQNNRSLMQKKIVVNYSHSHNSQCLAAGISISSTPEQLQQKQIELKAKNTIKISGRNRT